MAFNPKRASFYADLDLLRTHFEALDRQKTGYIGYGELTQLVRDMPTFEESMVPELMERLDRDKDGRISFEDFKVLFEQEREAAKHIDGRSRLGSLPAHFSTPIQTHHDTAFESIPSEIIVSPSDSISSEKRFTSRDFPDSPPVILRHKRLGRRSLPASYRREQKTPDFLSPIQPDKAPSGEMPDLATQMRHLTTAESPQLNRNSKVLSWISESEDVLFEDTGTGSGEEQGASSPPMSPTRDGSDEASHVRSILEGVCHSKEIGRDAIAKICSHAQADVQEEQALLAMLDQLDHRRQGWVPLDDFIRGLQSVRNASIVSSTPPPRLLSRRRYSDMPIPTLSEPFDTPLPSKEPPLASTPLPASAVADERAILSVLDPEHSGYVKVDSLVSNLQKMGVEAPHNHSLEEVLAEAVPTDPTGRVNVLDLTASLEGAMLGEGKTQSVLRQVALKSFKHEISLLRSQMNQVSLERDTLKTSLVRTQEENKKIVIEGDEHVDLVAKQSQRIIKEQEKRHSVRLREVERSRLEEAQLLQERAMQQVSKLEQTLNTLKVEEEKLRADFKYAQDQVQEVTERLSYVHRELSQKDRIIQSLHKDLSIRSDQGYVDDIETQLSRISELEYEISERTVQNQELAEKTRELQDRVDLLIADNEEWKQKYTAQKRKLQRRRSSGSLKQSDHQTTSRRRRLSSGAERQSIPQRPRSAGFRPLSNTPRRPVIARSHTPPPILEDLEELDIPEDPDSQNSEPDSPLLPAEVESNFLPGDTESSGSTQEGASSNDDLFARSTASIMEEIQQEEHRAMLQRRIDQLRSDKEQLELDCQELEQQLRSLDEGKQPEQRDDLHKELKSKRKKQAEIEKHIANLDRQRKRLSASRIEIDSQLANAEDSIAKQLEEIHSLKKLLVVSSDLESGSDIKLDHMVEELEQAKSQLMENQSSHRETVEKLLREIKALEEEKAVHIDHSQTVDREHSQLQEQVASLQDELQSDRAIHEEELNNFKKQLQDSQNLLSEAKDRYDTEISEAEKELESAQMELIQYREDVDSLRNKLGEAQVALEGSLASQHETAELQAKPPSDSPEESVAAEIAMLTATLEHSQEEIARYSEMNDHLQKQLHLCQATATATKDKAEEEVASLQSQLIAAHTEISDQATLYEEEISQLKEDHKKQADKSKKLAEIRMAEAKEEYERVARSIKHRCELQIETVKQQLKGSELRTKELQEKLLMTEGQCEDAHAEVSQLRDREAQTRQQIMEFQANEKRYKSEMSQLKTDAEQYRDELASLKVKEEQYQSQVAVLAEELQNRAAQKQAPVEAVAVDETDFMEMSLPRRPSSRSSYLSDTSMHEETITQMKSQLEDLQRMLMIPGKFSEEEGDEKLSLLQELIANNNTLQSDMQKAQQNIRSEQQGYLGQIEDMKQELKASELRIQALQEKLSMTEIQSEKALMEVNQLRDRGTHHQQQILEYQASEKKYKSEMSQLKTDAEKYKDELAALKDKEQQYQNQIAILAEELQCTAVQESPVTPPYSPTSRTAHKFDISTHEEMVTQMKSQLEDLQRMLVTRGESSCEEGDSEELSLIQELLANNHALQSDMRKAQQNFRSEQQGYLGQIEDMKQELKASEHNIQALQEKLSMTEIQSEKALMEVNQLRDRGTHHQQQILEYQASEKKYKSEMSQLKTDAEKYKDELAALKDKEQQYQNQRAILAEELQCTAVQESPVTPLYSPTSRTAHKFDISTHEEVVTQMKLQLEDLQRMLVTRGESSCEEGDSEELSLIQELLANNNALQSDRRKAQQNVLSEQQTHLSMIASKEEELEHLKSEISRQKHAVAPSADGSQAEMVALRHTKETQVEQEMNSLQDELKVKSNSSPAIATAVAVTATNLEAQIFHSTAQANSEGTTQTESKEVIQKDETQLKEEIQALKDEIEQRKVSEKKAQNSLEDVEAELHSLRSQLAHWQAEARTSTQANKEREVQLRDRAIKRKDEEIKALKEDLERLKLSNREAQNVKASTAAEVKKLQDKLREEEAITATLRAEINKNTDKPAAEHKAKANEQALSDKAQLEIKQRDEIIARKNEEIRKMTAEIEEANASMTESIYAQELAETEIKRKHSALQQQERTLSAYDQQIKELQHKLDAVVSEPVEAVIQYVESAPLESVNEAVLIELQRDVQAERAKVRQLQAVQPNAQQLQTTPEEAVPDFPEHSKQLAVLRMSVQQAEEELKASQAAQEDLRQQQVQLMEELREERAQKISAAQLVSEAQTEELRELHASLIALPEGGSYRQQLDHSTMVQEIKSEVESLKAQLHHAQVAFAELEQTFGQKIQEYDQQELQFHTEHEEEVRALHQQKQQLAKQIEDLKQHYHRLLNDQDSQNTVLLEDLVSRKAQLEGQLQQRADDHFRSYQQVADLLEEKKILIDIIRQLCIEAGKEIEVG